MGEKKYPITVDGHPAKIERVSVGSYSALPASILPQDRQYCWLNVFVAFEPPVEGVAGFFVEVEAKQWERDALVQTVQRKATIILADMLRRDRIRRNEESVAALKRDAAAVLATQAKEALGI